MSTYKDRIANKGKRKPLTPNEMREIQIERNKETRRYQEQHKIGSQPGTYPG